MNKIVELEHRKVLIGRAKYLMDKYLYEPLFALKIAEQEIEEQIKNGDIENRQQINEV